MTSECNVMQATYESIAIAGVFIHRTFNTPCPVFDFLYFRFYDHDDRL